MNRVGVSRLAMMVLGLALLSGHAASQENSIEDPFAGARGPRPFLIITPDEFMAALEPLVAHKNSTGMPSIAVSIGQLTSHFPGNRHLFRQNDST